MGAMGRAQPHPPRPAGPHQGEPPTQARRDARTRDRLLILPVPVRAVDQWRRDTAAALAVGRLVPPGEKLSGAGQTGVRSIRLHAIAGNGWACDPLTSRHRILNREEDHAFWAWAIIEVLRLTGARVEELLELNHHSVAQYRLPATGELVALLLDRSVQKRRERLLVVSPELADVLSAIIRRVRDDNGAVPVVRARDVHEHVWLPPSPLLFQRRLGAAIHALSIGPVSTLLDDALAARASSTKPTAPRCAAHP